MARIVSVNRAAPLLAFVTWNARPSQDAGSSSFSFSSRLPCLTSSPSFNPSFFAVDIRLPAVCWGVRAGLIFPCHICLIHSLAGVKLNQPRQLGQLVVGRDAMAELDEFRCFTILSGNSDFSGNPVPHAVARSFGYPLLPGTPAFYPVVSRLRRRRVVPVAHRFPLILRTFFSAAFNIRSSLW